MKSTLAKISLLTLVGAVSIASAFAADAPKCPRTMDYQFTAAGQLNGAWVVQTQFEPAEVWQYSQITMYDSDVTNQDQAVQRGSEIRDSVWGYPAESKVYKNGTQTGPYYYRCTYPITQKSVGLGDSAVIFSVTYDDTAGGASVKAATRTSAKQGGLLTQEAVR